MIDARPSPRPEVLTWALAVFAAVAGHVAVAMTLLARAPDVAVDDAVAGAMVVELAPVAVARAYLPANAPVGVDQAQGAAALPQAGETQRETEREPAPERPPDTTKLDLPTSTQAAATPPVEPPIPRPEPAQRSDARVGAVTTTAAQVEAKEFGERAAATTVGGARVDLRAVAAWNSRLAAVLEKNKRYPAAAKAHRQEGTVEVNFSIDREGRLKDRRITRSSRVAALDAEALALVERSQPFPVPPAGMPGVEFSFSVPIQFNIR